MGPQESANQFGTPSQQGSPSQQHQPQQQQQQQQSTDASAGWGYSNSPAHPNALPSNVINAYTGSFNYQQHSQQAQGQESLSQAQQHNDRLVMMPDDYQRQYDASMGDSSSAATAATAADLSGLAQQHQEQQQQQQQQHHQEQQEHQHHHHHHHHHHSPDDSLYDDEGAKKKAKTASGRVAKACQPCSSKKRRCDGGKPECSVCKVLGTPCSYNQTGLKRGPPKGFRSGPRESARAKLTRVLETTIRDLTNQLGAEEAGREITRVSRERGLVGLPSDGSGELAVIQAALANSGHADFGVTQQAIESSLAAEDDSFVGVNERGELMHRGSSSGIQLLRRQGAAHSASSPSEDSQTQGATTRTNAGAAPMVLPIPSPGAHQPFLRAPRVDQILNSVNNSQRADRKFEAVNGSGVTALGVPLDSFEDPYVSPEESHKLFDNYWRSFHPYWPILYKAVLDEIPAEEVASRLDGLLLNAIYAIGSSGRDHDNLGRSQGPDDAARRSGEVFAQAAERRLYASGLRPTVSAIQASFMLSLFAHGTGELSRAWSFCGIAINMAMDLGLHRWPIHRLDLLDNSVERETRTRTIWSLYILDKILCAEMGRSPILRAREMDPPLLSEDAPDEMEYMDGNPAKPMRIASVFNAAVHCFAIVERILSEVHSLRRKAVLRRGESTPEILHELDGELEKWTRNLPEHLRIPEDFSVPQVGFPGIVWALGVWEATATILLHRPFIPQGSEDSPPTMEDVINNQSHQKASAAADRLCRLLHLDVSSRPADYDVALWPSDYAYCLFTAAVMYLFNARIGVAGARQKFARSRDQLKRLSSRWPAASAHRQLLDGFTAVADDALGRPETSSGEPTAQRNDAASIEAWTAQTASAPGSFGLDTSGDVKSDTVGAGGHAQQDGSGSAVQAAMNAGGSGSASDGQKNADGLTFDQRQQLLNFYLDSSHRIGQTNDSRRQLDALAPGLFDVETAFWNESAGSSTLSYAFGNNGSMGAPGRGASTSEVEGAAGQGSDQDQQQQQQGSSSSSGGKRDGQQHNGLAMLAALAPHAAPQQQGQGQQDGSGEGASAAGQQQQQHLAPTSFQPVAQQLHAAQQQASPFAFSLDPGQPAWTDPLMGALDLGPAGGSQNHAHANSVQPTGQAGANGSSRSGVAGAEGQQSA